MYNSLIEHSMRQILERKIIFILQHAPEVRDYKMVSSFNITGSLLLMLILLKN
jgi:hypothetical protein